MKQLLFLIPESSKYQIKKILQASNIAIKITKKRKTKHGDFRRYTNGTSLITVNNTSNPYRFLITLLHELAHFKVSQLYPYKVKPHGLEWKSIYREILIPFLNPDIFPEPICGLLANHMKNPKASTDRDFKLIIALRQFDPSSSKTLIYQLKDGKHFALENGRVFIKLKKRRILFECREKSSGKIYLFSPQSEVKPIYY
ncbi:ImmA/IrrE family metallo-endopeptidase [Flavobacteriaceae bacterium]|nr:ImmA/IrrE family metallo-endopeptidase [Flavobacteriaceae bacterium]